MDKTYETKKVRVQVIGPWDGTYKHAKDIQDYIGNVHATVSHEYDDVFFYIITLEGHMRVTEGDFILKGVMNEYWPCKPAAFHHKYQLVE